MEKTGGFKPEIVSLGSGAAGGMRPSLIQESCDRSETLSTLTLLDHNVDSISSSNLSNGGVASPSDHSAAIQRSPEITIFSSSQENLAVLDDDDKVDTSLSLGLSPSGSSNEKLKPQKRGRSADGDHDQDRKKRMFKKVADDDVSGGVNTALRLSVYSYFQTDRVETLSYPTVLDVEVDTNFISRNYVSTSPVRCIFLDFSYDDEVDTTLSLRPLGSANKKSTKRRELIKKRYNKKKALDDEDEGPLVPIEEIQGLFETLLSRTGTRPVFLYRKKLQESDVKGDQNRLFITKRERLMGFLTEEEVAAVDGGGKGLKVVGIDGGGKVYKKLGLNRWASLNMVVINSDWRKVVAANNAKKGDVVEIWGYRENGKACLAFNFRRERDGGDTASSRLS